MRCLSSDLQTKITACRNESGVYYENFRKTLEEGEPEKAGEFLWGAVVKLLKAHALLHGVPLNKHGKTKAFVAQLAQELQNREIMDRFKKAEALHANFYHSWMDQEAFTEHVNEVIQLLQKLESLLLSRQGVDISP